MKKRGHTMIELVIYIFMACLAAAAIMALYDMAKRTQSSAFSSYLMSGQTELAIARLRQDLQQSALPSIVAYPNSTNTTQPPGVAFPAAYRDKINVSPYGQPNWDRHVYYSLQPEAGKTTTGKLIRWEQPITKPTFLPMLPPLAPSPAAVPPATALHDVLMPDQAVTGLKDQPNYKADKFGGFRVQFVTRQGGDSGAPGATSDNPGSAANKAKDDHTTLLEVEFKILSRGSMGKADFYTLRFRVHPKY